MRTRTFMPSIESLFRPAAALAMLATVAAMSACTDSTSPNAQNAGGTYQLSTVNGSAIPYTYGSGSSTITINSDIYTLQPNGTYSETIDETLSDGYSTQPANDAESGNWYQSGNAVVFQPTYSTLSQQPTQYTGSLAGGGTFSHSTLTFSSGGVVWVYSHT
jgi:hypothetical protein